MTSAAAIPRRSAYTIAAVPSRRISAASHAALASVLVELSIGANLLTWIGSRYVADGGTLAEKLHPGTYLAYVAALLALAGPRGGMGLLWRQRELAAFLLCIIGCIGLAAIFTGTSNLIVLFDNFLPAGCLGLALAEAPPPARARLKLLLQLGIFANAMLALGEFAAGSHLLPLYLNGVAATELAEDFRPIALYDHPLTGATATLIGFFVAPSARWPLRRALYLLGLAAGLVAFGGRAALAAGLLACLWLAAGTARTAWATRRPLSGWTLARAATLLGLLGIFAAVALDAGFAGRIAHHGVWDASAQSRLLQWQILSWLDTRQILFGAARPDLLAHLEMLRLASGIDVIENFALLMFATLGVIGFPLFLFGLWWLLLWCWRRSGPPGRLLVVCFLLAISASNSLGRKSTLLLLFTATCMATWREMERPR